MDFSKELKIDADTTLAELLHSAYSAGWCDGYDARGVEFDWIDEGFVEYLDKSLSVHRE